MIFDPKEQYLQTREAAQLYPGPEKPCPRSIARHCSEGLLGAAGQRIKLPSLVLRGKRLIPRSALLEFLEAITRAPDGPVFETRMREPANDHCTRAERALAAQGA